MKGVSQEEFADKIGVSRQAVSKWESEQSVPDLDKIIIMSEYFDVTTDYLLKGIESTGQDGSRTVDAGNSASVATAVNFIGWITAIAGWYEKQLLMNIAGGLAVMAVGCMIFSIGLANSKKNITKAKSFFWCINVWVLSFIPLSSIYNLLFRGQLAPYPMPNQRLWSYPVFWLLYIGGCTTVVLLNSAKKHKNNNL